MISLILHCLDTQIYYEPLKNKIYSETLPGNLTFVSNITSNKSLELGNLLPNFKFQQGSIEGGSVGVIIGGSIPGTNFMI